MKINNPKLGMALAIIVAGIVIWGAAAWPAPLHFSTAIPYCENRGASAKVCDLRPGDHIQLLYHFWLLRDVVAGETPVFTNPWEFNIGDDKVTCQFSTYYLPFSAIYAAVSSAFGNAAGWNAASMFSIILGIFGLYLLAMRFSNTRWIAFICAVIGTSFPYRWFTLIGGSPTGFAICFVPWVFYGIDRAVRDYSLRGSLIAGLAVLFSYTSDLHVFYFAALACPLFIAVSYFASAECHSLARIFRTMKALAPFVALAATSAIVSVLASGEMSSTNMSNGWPLSAVKLFSPIVSAVFRRDALGMSKQIYTGIAMILLAFFLLAVAIRSRQRQRIILVSILGAAALCIYLLSVGTYGPFNALPLRAARKLIPKYDMIRQVTKAFCLMPTVFAAYMAISLSAHRGRSRYNVVQCVIIAGLASIAFIEHVSFFRAGLCRLPEEIPGYRVVADDDHNAHALAVTFWPGDTHWSSLCEYGAMTSHIKMLNGYSPSISSSYITNVYQRLESVNQGDLSNDQVDYLLSMGVTHLIFNEHPFLPKTSLATSGITLARLASNPRLKIIGKDEGTWAFRIIDEDSDKEPIQITCPFAAIHHWYGKKLDGKCSQEENGSIRINTQLHGIFSDAPGLRYEMLLSGGGKLTCSVDTNSTVNAPLTPTWVSFPLPTPSGCSFYVTDGVVKMHHALVTAGPSSLEGDSFTFPAALFQHSGETDSPVGAVIFHSDGDLPGLALFGPDLPFKSGEWEASIKLSSESDEICGSIKITTISDTPKQIGYAKAKANGVTSVRFFHDGIRPLRLSFHYNKRIGGGKSFPIKVTEVKFEKCNGEEASAGPGEAAK